MPALVDLGTSDWFGAGDLGGFLVFTLPFVLVLVVIGRALARRLAHRATGAGLVIGGIAGVALGLLWTLANLLLLGGWFGAWSFPVLLCWTTGGALGLASAASTRSARGWRRTALESLAYLFVATVALFAFLPSWAYLTNDQHLTLVYGRIRHRGPATIDDSREILLPEDRQLLARAGIAGTIEILGDHAANTTERPRARILVLLDGPVDRVHRLPQPDATTVLYVQDGDSFRRFPADAKVLSDRVVEFHPGPDERKQPGYWVEGAGGQRSGADLSIERE